MQSQRQLARRLERGGITFTVNPVVLLRTFLCFRLEGPPREANLQITETAKRRPKEGGHNLGRRGQVPQTVSRRSQRRPTQKEVSNERPTAVPNATNLQIETAKHESGPRREITNTAKHETSTPHASARAVRHKADGAQRPLKNQS